MALSETIYRLRTEHGLSQGDLASELDVSRQSISKWETGSSVPELDKLVAMSRLFGVTLDELVLGVAQSDGAEGVEAPEPEAKPVEVFIKSAPACVTMRHISIFSVSVKKHVSTMIFNILSEQIFFSSFISV